MDWIATIAMILSLLPRWVSMPIGVVLAAAFLRWFFRRQNRKD